MIDLGPAAEDAMVLAFLQAEIDSARFGSIYQAILANSGLDRVSVIDNPDRNSQQLTRPDENYSRLFAGSVPVKLSSLASPLM